MFWIHKRKKLRVRKRELSEKSKRSWGIPAYYEDEAYSCVECGKRCLFSAMQQKEWYEVKKRYLGQRPIRCADCHLAWRETRSSKFKMDRLLTSLKDDPCDRERMVACALEIVGYHRRTGRGNLDLALHLLKAQQSDESLILEALDYCRSQVRRS